VDDTDENFRKSLGEKNGCISPGTFAIMGYLGWKADMPNGRIAINIKTRWSRKLSKLMAPALVSGLCYELV